MKIGIGIDGLHRYGGTGRSVYELAEYLGRWHDVTIFTTYAELQGQESFKTEIISIWPNVPYINKLIFAWKVSQTKKTFNLDILNVHGSNGLWQDVVTVHSIHKKWFLYSLGQLRRFSSPWWKKILNPIHYVTILIETIQYSFGLHRKIIVISKQEKKDLLTHFRLHADQVEVVPHGVNTREFAPAENSLVSRQVRSSLKLQDEDFVMVFAAHEFRRKGLAIIMQAMARLKDTAIHLLVIGQDDPVDFQKEAVDLGIEGNTHFLGRQKNISTFYHAADAFVFPTSYEAFGLVITEAMSCGLPVIVPANAGAAELIHDGVDGLLLNRWDNVDQLVEKISLLRSDPKVRQSIGKAARRNTESYSWEQAARKTEEVFLSLKA